MYVAWKYERRKMCEEGERKLTNLGQAHEHPKATRARTNKSKIHTRQPRRNDGQDGEGGAEQSARVKKEGDKREMGEGAREQQQTRTRKEI